MATPARIFFFGQPNDVQPQTRHPVQLIISEIMADGGTEPTDLLEQEGQINGSGVRTRAQSKEGGGPKTGPGNFSKTVTGPSEEEDEVIGTDPSDPDYPAIRSVRYKTTKRGGSRLNRFNVVHSSRDKSSSVRAKNKQGMNQNQGRQLGTPITSVVPESPAWDNRDLGGVENNLDESSGTSTTIHEAPSSLEAVEKAHQAAMRDLVDKNRESLRRLREESYARTKADLVQLENRYLETIGQLRHDLDEEKKNRDNAKRAIDECQAIRGELRRSIDNEKRVAEQFARIKEREKELDRENLLLKQQLQINSQRQEPMAHTGAIPKQPVVQRPERREEFFRSGDEAPAEQTSNPNHHRNRQNESPAAELILRLVESMTMNNDRSSRPDRKVSLPEMKKDDNYVRWKKIVQHELLAKKVPTDQWYARLFEALSVDLKAVMINDYGSLPSDHYLTLFQQMDERFRGQNNEQRARVEISKIRMKQSQSLTEFMDEMDKAFDKYPGRLSETEKNFLFLNGLREPLSTKVNELLSHPSGESMTHEQLLQYLKATERYTPAQQTNSRSLPNRTNEDRNSLAKKDEINKPAEQKGTEVRSKTACFSCGKEGHRRIECPTRAQTKRAILKLLSETYLDEEEEDETSNGTEKPESGKDEGTEEGRPAPQNQTQ